MGLRVHLVQALALVATYDQHGDFLSELTDDPVAMSAGLRLGRLARYPQISDLLTANRASYMELESKRLRAAFEFARFRQADLLVFPEYGLSGWAIRIAQDFVRSFHISAILGSHRVSRELLASGVYTGADYRGPGDEPVVGSAIAPILTAPKSDLILVPKAYRSKWEPTLQLIRPTDRVVEIPDCAGSMYRVGVLVCIDGLQPESFAQVAAERPDAVVVVANSPQTDVFKYPGTMLSWRQIEFLLASPASQGSSSVHIHPSSVEAIGYREDIYPPGRGVEAVVEVDLPDLDSLRVRGSTETEDARRYPRVYPITYESQPWLADLDCTKEECETFLSEVVPNTEDAEYQLELFLHEHSTQLGGHMRTRLEQAFRQIKNFEAWGHVEQLLTVAPMGPGFQLWLASRVAQSRTALKGIEERLELDDEDYYGDLTTKLRKLRRKLPQPSQAVPKAPPPRQQNTDTMAELLARVKGRGPLFTQLETFFREGEGGDAGLLLVGGQGMGKTSAVRVVFPKSLSQLRPVWVNVPSQSSFATVVERIADAYNTGIDIDRLRSSSQKVFSHQILRILRIVTSQVNRPLIVDDLGEMSQEVRNQNQFRYFIEVLSKLKEECRSRVVLISSISWPYADFARGRVRVVRMSGLAAKEARHSLRWHLEYHGKNLGSEGGDFSRRFLQTLGGNPLAIGLVAQSMSQDEVFAALRGEDISFVTSRIVESLLPKVEIERDEEVALGVLSVLREPQPANAVSQIVVDLHEGVLKRCARKSLVDYDGSVYALHSLFRDHFYSRLDESRRTELHSLVADFYKARIDLSPTESYPLPLYAELVYHLTGAGRLPEAKLFSTSVASEILPMARRLYKMNKREPVQALRVYEALREILPSEPVVYASIGRCSFRLGNVDEVDPAFENAVSLEKANGGNAGWLYRDWGQILHRGRHYERCVEKFQMARELGLRDPSMDAIEAMILWERDHDLQAALEETRGLRDRLPEHDFILDCLVRLLKEAVRSGSQELRMELSEVSAQHERIRMQRDYYLSDFDPWEEYADGDSLPDALARLVESLPAQ